MCVTECIPHVKVPMESRNKKMFEFLDGSRSPGKASTALVPRVEFYMTKYVYFKDLRGSIGETFVCLMNLKNI